MYYFQSLNRHFIMSIFTRKLSSKSLVKGLSPTWMGYRNTQLYDLFVSILYSSSTCILTWVEPLLMQPKNLLITLLSFQEPQYHHHCKFKGLCVNLCSHTPLIYMQNSLQHPPGILLQYENRRCQQPWLSNQSLETQACM